MAIRVETEKVKGRDGRMRKLVKMEALRWDALPQGYKDGKPRCDYMALELASGLDVIDAEGYSAKPREGEVLSEERFQQLIETLRACGDRLKKINDQIRKELEGWEGKETFVI